MYRAHRVAVRRGRQQFSRKNLKSGGNSPGTHGGRRSNRLSNIYSRSGARGIVNVTNAGSCSWCEFAQEVLRQAGRAAVRVLPISTAEAQRLAKRPAYSVLSSASLHAHQITLRSWQEATSAYLQDLRTCGKLL